MRGAEPVGPGEMPAAVAVRDRLSRPGTAGPGGALFLPSRGIRRLKQQVVEAVEVGAFIGRIEPGEFVVVTEVCFSNHEKLPKKW